MHSTSKIWVAFTSCNSLEDNGDTNHVNSISLNRRLHIFFNTIAILDHYYPICTSCGDCMKLGIYPDPGKCFNITDKYAITRECCYNKLFLPTEGQVFAEHPLVVHINNN